MALQPIGAERYAEETRHCNGDVSSGRPAAGVVLGIRPAGENPFFWDLGSGFFSLLFVLIFLNGIVARVNDTISGHGMRQQPSYLGNSPNWVTGGWLHRHRRSCLEHCPPQRDKEKCEEKEMLTRTHHKK